MIIFIRDSKGNNMIDCEIFVDGTGKVKIKSAVDKSCKLDLTEYNDKTKTLDGVSSIDNALDEVHRHVKRTLQTAIKDNPELSLIED